jgi:hypothetical protein
MHLNIFDRLPREYTAQYRKRLSFSYSPLWVPETHLTFMQHDFFMFNIQYTSLTNVIQSHKICEHWSEYLGTKHVIDNSSGYSN